MRTFDDLEAAWQAATPLPTGRAAVDLIVLRKGGGRHQTPEAVRLTPEDGIIGDRWADGKRDPASQVTLMMTRVAELIGDGERPLHQAGDNFLVGLDLSQEALPPGTRIRLGSALLEVSAKPHLGCQKFHERFGAEALRWVNIQANRERRLRGVNCRVLQGGDVALGDPIEVASKGRGEPT